MTPETYRLAGEVFEQLRDLPEAELAPALDSACGTNEQLRSEVLRLLEANRDAGNTSFLERRAFEDAARLAAKHGVALPAAGSIIGNYRMVARVAAGGMGVVYEGLDLRLARRVAIKILPETFTGEGEERIRRFRREARAASKLNHPHIISIFDAAFADGYHYIAMEFVEGRTLRQIISARTQPDPEMVLDWIAQTASALDAAHQAGIVHRDIKPENIMVRSDGFVKVLDFGLAKLREGSSQVDSGTDLQTRPGNLAGTSRYLSPEQIMGEPAGPRSDIFSLGVVAYELWTGVRPFEGPTDGAVFNAILHLAPAPPSSRCPSLSPEMDGLILRALEKDPDLRFQTAGDLRSACRRVSRDRIASSQPRQKSTVIRDTPIPDAAASRGRGKRRWISAALVGVVGLLGITGAATFWASRTANPPHVTRIVQLTNGETKQRFVTDGTRLYFAAGNRDADMRVYQMSVRGGDPQPIPQLTGMLPFDISPDRTELLLGQTGSAATIDGPFPIWVADTVGNAPRRVGDLVANEARYSPSGDEILYAFDRELRTARTDGSHSRLLSSMKGRVLYPVWAPDSQTIRFSVESKRGTVLWEVAPDGTGLRPVPEWAGYDLGATAWTADGKFYFASAGKGNEGGRDLWVIPRSGRLSWAQSKPVRLTSGPLRVSLPAPNQGERRVLFQGSVEVGELVRYDGRSNAWLPYLNGFPAMQVDYAPNGKWIAYARSPDGTIWRSALDGTERVQLTTSPFVAMNPRWSPDGSKITFFGQRPGSLSRIYVAEVKSGSIRQVTNGNWGSFKDDDGSWSPDSNSLVFGATYDEQLTDPRQRLGLAVVDLRTGHITKLPGTEGLWGPRWSPDGRYIAALGFPDQLWLYDWEKRTATRLANIGAGWPSWSRDSQYIYFLNTPGTYWSRMRIKDASVERLIRLSGFKLSPVSFGWVGLTPDGSAISLRQPNTTEIYALDWEEP